MSDGKTQVIPAMRRRTKADTVKAWTPIIVAIISLFGMITVAWMQNRSSGRVDRVSEYVNEILLPDLQKKIERLLERQARIEGILEEMRRRPVGRNNVERALPKAVRGVYREKVEPMMQSQLPVFKAGD